MLATKRLSPGAIVATCTIVGLLWRAEGLLRRSFWLDEVLTFWRARLPTIDLLLIDLKSSPFPPLYYLMLRGWVGIWGISELAVRALPMAIGVATLPATYLVWAPLVGRRSAAWAVALLSTNAFHVFYSQDAKMYAAVWLLATLGGGAFLRAIEGGPRRGAWLAVYGASIAASLLTSYVGAVPLAIQLFYGLVALPRIRPVASRLAITAALACLPLLLWIPTTARTVSQRTGISWIPPASGERISSELTQAFGSYVLGYRTVPAPPDDGPGRLFSRLHGPIVGLAAAVIVVYLIRRSRGEVHAEDRPAVRVPFVVPYLVLWASLPAVGAFLLSATVYPIWGPPRYLMASGPALLLLLGCALGSIERRALAYALGATLILANAAVIVFVKTHVTADPHRQLVDASAEVARDLRAAPDSTPHALDTFSVTHLEAGSLSDWNATCVKYEIERINARSVGELLQPDGLDVAIGRGRAFFVIELRPAGLPEAVARGRMEGRIAAARVAGSPSTRDYEVRPIASAEVRADGPLPNPLMPHIAQLWSCLPVEAGAGPDRGPVRPPTTLNARRDEP